MNIKLNPEDEALVHAIMKEQRFYEPDDVISMGLKLLYERGYFGPLKDHLLQEAIQKGLDDMKAGRYGKESVDVIEKEVEVLFEKSWKT